MDVSCGDNTKALNSKKKKKKEMLQEKAIRIINFLPNNAPVSKEMHKLRILKLKDFITLQNILFVYDCLEAERMKSFSTTFKRMETNQVHNKYIPTEKTRF